MPKIGPFESHAQEYEQWFEDHLSIYLSEVLAIKSISPVGNKPVELGIGSGRFALPLQIYEGIEPAGKMRKIAAERGITATDGVAEALPYDDQSKDYVLLVTTICFVDDIDRTFSEIYRILEPGGILIIGFIDSKSSLGQQYLVRQHESIFYRNAVFYSTDDVYQLLQKHGFIIDKTYQTIFGTLDSVTNVQEPLEGYGEGSFVVIKGVK